MSQVRDSSKEIWREVESEPRSWARRLEKTLRRRLPRREEPVSEEGSEDAAEESDDSEDVCAEESADDEWAEETAPASLEEVSRAADSEASEASGESEEAEEAEEPKDGTDDASDSAVTPVPVDAPEPVSASGVVSEESDALDEEAAPLPDSLITSSSLSAFDVPCTSPLTVRGPRVERRAPSASASRV
jgi:hypothetical protein